MIKKLLLALLCLCLLCPAARAAQAEWTYPVPANILEDKTGLLILTNKKELMPSDFEPYHLKEIKLRRVSRGMMLRKEALDALTAFFHAAEKDGKTLVVKSAYRSYGTQKTMYDNRLAKYGKDDGVVAYPGSSDHQTGLAVDVLNVPWTKQEGMRPEFGETEEAKWMEKNCARFGFVLRYMPEKQEITGIIYEPWHFRYVGPEVARYMMENRLSLEEFVDEYRAAISDFEQRGGDFKQLCKQLNQLPVPTGLNITDDSGDEEVSLYGGH